MDCIKEKKFLLWRWKRVEHNYKMHRIRKFMKSSSTFHVDYKCEVCVAEYTRKFVEQDELILAGISVETLNNVDDMNWHSCRSKQQ